MKQVAAVLLAGLFLTGVARDARAGDGGPSTGQRLAVHTKPAVVRVMAGYLVDINLGQGSSQRHFVGGHGSGFFASPDGYIVTNAHVVDMVHKGDEQAHAQIVNDFLAQLAKENPDVARLPPAQRDALVRKVSQAIKLAKKVSVVILPNGDQLVYDIKAFGTPVGLSGSKDVAVLKVQTRNAPTLLLGDESSIEIQDTIYAVGYPAATDDLVGVLDEKSTLEATITDGKVSAMKKTSDGVQVIQVTTVISPGNSGGPAVNQQGQVIGLATFKATQAEGYNFLVPASTVKEFLRQSGVQNEDSLTNLAFRKGLGLYWDGRYSEAIKEFEEVRQLFPAHTEALALITHAQELKRQGKEKSSSSGAGIAAGVIGGAVLLAGIAFVVVRRGGRGGAAAHAAPPGWPQAQHGARPPQPHGAPHAGMAPPHGPPPGPPPQSPPAHGGHGAHAGHGPPAHAGHGAHAGHAAPPGGPPPAAGPAARTIAVSPGAGGTALAGLACVRGVLRGQHFQIGAHGIVIGREASAAQVVIPDGRVSSKHVWIGFQDGMLMAIDQGSTNGTFVNDMGRGRITRSELRHGDTVIVSEPDVLTFHVLLQGGAAPKRQ